jgi:hypothetical protein
MTSPCNISRAAGSRWLAAPGVLCRAGGRWRARLMLLMLMFGMVIAGAPSASAQDEKPIDYQVKAAFLVNFPKYVDWPASDFAKSNSAITVAVFGDDNVANEFQNMIQSGLVISGHPVVLKRIQSEADIADCQILFIAASEQSRAAAILDKLKGSAVLTVGESANFLEQGGMVNLVPKNRKIRLQVNLTAASQAHLRISSRLLVAADFVKGKQG